MLSLLLTADRDNRLSSGTRDKNVKVTQGSFFERCIPSFIFLICQGSRPDTQEYCIIPD